MLVFVSGLSIKDLIHFKMLSSEKRLIFFFFKVREARRESGVEVVRVMESSLWFLHLQVWFFLFSPSFFFLHLRSLLFVTHILFFFLHGRNFLLQSFCKFLVCPFWKIFSDWVRHFPFGGAEKVLGLPTAKKFCIR